MSYKETTFERIYQTNFRRVYSFLYKLCYDEDTAEELTQETFYQAYKSLGRYSGECDIFTWLAAIAKNMFLKHLRRMRKESLVIDLYVTEPESPLSEDPGYRLTREIEVKDLRRAIRSVPKKYSDVLILRVYGELPFREIAAQMGITENSAKVIYYRAKNMIREILFHA